jgi:uncharacterized cupin superfamily protein
VLREPDTTTSPCRQKSRVACTGAGAHKVSNSSDMPARIMSFSSAREPSVAVYPDSDKIGVWPGTPDDTVMLRRADGAVEYFDGER